MSGRDGFWASLKDAFSLSNIFLRFFLFFIVGLLTAVPYVVLNIDKITLSIRDSGLSGFPLFLSFFKALMGAIWSGVFIGMSTVVDTIINLVSGVSVGWGTLVFSVFFFLFGVFVIFQPTSLVMNILDMRRGRESNFFVVLLVSLGVTVIVFAPLSWLVTGGETITSNVQFRRDVVGDVVGVNDSVVNESGNGSVISDALLSLDLLGGVS